ncbi:MAG: hypothetical protein HYT94_04535 [Parcubacteria group bacterium]|nr:hypothetical protein [Parcubacteria group bacterium]
MFQKIDWFFLSHFEKGCHFLQRLTGKTNYYYAGFCSFLIVMISLGVYYHLFPKELVGENTLIVNHKHPTWFWYGVFLFTNYFTWVWKISETCAYDRISHGLSNPSKINIIHRFIRLNFIVATPIFVLLPIPEIQIYDKVFELLLTLFIFFMDCDPLPPCKGKVKEWLASFGKKPVLVPIKTEK